MEILAAVIGGLFGLLAVVVAWWLVKREKPVLSPGEQEPVSPSGGLPLAVAIGVVQRDDNVLLVRRKRAEGKLAWQFPAGIVKPAEEPAEVVVDEVKKETGVTCKVEEKIGTRLHPDTGAVCHYFRCLYLRGEAVNVDQEENSEVAWVSAGEVTKYITSDLYSGAQHLVEQMTKQETQPKIIVAIVDDGSRVLLVRRRQKEGALHWQFPAGAVNPGEIETAAAVREVFEEAGVRCTATRKLGERTHPDTGRSIAYWLCAPSSTDAVVKDAEELDAVEWMTPDEVFDSITSDIYPAVREYIEELRGD